MKCQLDPLCVHYETIGQGKPFLTISGIPSDHRILKSWMEPIFQKRPGWQRFYFDLPGTGQTSQGMLWESSRKAYSRHPSRNGWTPWKPYRLKVRV